ncbi:hypothetical protein MLD38_011593 [Melastoma candidum]|uniref:Uncharacterized protein n=1 Tax=Melastoma candidum TaxID=119954 RepID=A0ACB9R2Z2_9MYRT|nr:hypothetical protein MLD38_011593 [Melastoma candidum]
MFEQSILHLWTRDHSEGPSASSELPGFPIALLEQAVAQKLMQLTWRHVRSKSIEKELKNEASSMVKAFEAACSQEIALRIEAEDALDTILLEQQKALEKKEELARKLQRTMRNVALLDSRAGEVTHKSEETAQELRVIEVSIASLRLEKQRIQIQKAEAAHWLDRWKNSCQSGASRLQAWSKRFRICVEVLSKLQHSQLVSLLGACSEARSLVYLPNGSLLDHLLQKKVCAPLSWKDRVRIIAEIASALCFLHSSKPERIIHGNLKPENILLDSKLGCKICDFGICRLISDENLRCPSFHHTSEPKNFPFTDPEFHRDGVLTAKSDVYSFKLVVLQLLTGRLPLGLLSEVRKAVSHGNPESLFDLSAGEWPPSVVTPLLDLSLQCCESIGRIMPDLTPSLVSDLELLHTLEERPVPSFFLCPILREIMHDPQIAADGFTY